MNIFLAQQNYRIGDFEGNLGKITQAIQQAEQQDADLVIFSELCLCGYPPRDFLEFEDFIDDCEQAVASLQELTANTAVVVGAPFRNTAPEGKDLFNSACFIYQGKVQHITHKTCLPTYDIFDEYRYFEPAFDWKVVAFKGKKIALTICEDIWSLGDDPLYRISPMDKLIKQQPDVIINLSASPFDYDQREKRMAVIRANVKKYNIPLFYCNTVGAQTEMIFDGGSLIMNAAGKVEKEFPFFEEALDGCTLDMLGSPVKAVDQVDKEAAMAPDLKAPLHPATGNMPVFTRGQLARLPYEPGRHIDRIYHALILGIRDYFRKLNFKKAIVGSSGGIDSAVAVTLACDALGSENVRAIMMPSPFSTEHSVNDAVQLSKNLNNAYDIIGIQAIYHSFLDTLKPQFEDLPFGLAEENIQARTRGNLLMALANKFGYILLNTSNKSELAVGYGTLYGDMAGGISVLGDLYKTQVYALAEYINRKRTIIPENILTKAPSAELRPDQKDSDSLPDYQQLDHILYEYIEHRLGPKQILSTQPYDQATVQRVLSLVNSNEYKRNQFCPVLRVSCKAFGAGRRVPIVGKYLS